MMHMCSLYRNNQAARLYGLLRRSPGVALTVGEIATAIKTTAPATVLSNVRKWLEMERSEFRLVKTSRVVRVGVYNRAGECVGTRMKKIPAYKIEKEISE